MVAPDSHRISRAPWYLGYPLGSLEFKIQDFHLLWLFIPKHSSIRELIHYAGPATPLDCSKGLGSSLFARHYLGNLIRFLFLSLLRCFSSGGSPLGAMYSRITNSKELGFPIRKSPDQSLLINSPRLIADKLRPSSVLSAKASVVCLIGHFIILAIAVWFLKCHYPSTLLRTFDFFILIWPKAMSEQSESNGGPGRT